MAVDMSKEGNRLVLSSFKPKAVDMHNRADLKLFRDTAEATGISLGIPEWRWSLEVGSKLYKGLVEKNGIKEKEIQKLFEDDGVQIHVVKQEGAGASPAASSSSGDSPMDKAAQGLVEEESKPSSSTPSVIDLTKEDYSSPSMPDVVMEAFKISKEEFKRVSIGSQTRYIYSSGNHWKLEPLERLPKRMEMWEWMVACLRKGKEKGPYSHLAEQVTRYDVAGLFIAITESVDLQHPYIFWNGFEEFVNSRPEKGEDIFAYFVRLDKMVENLTIRTAGHMLTLTNITPVSDSDGEAQDVCCSFILSRIQILFEQDANQKASGMVELHQAHNHRGVANYL